MRTELIEEDGEPRYKIIDVIGMLKNVLNYSIILLYIMLFIIFPRLEEWYWS